MTSALYRSYLRILEKWPLDVSKKGRDLGEHIRILVAENFRASEPRETAQCEKIHATLSRLASNKHKEAFYVSTSSSASGLSLSECQQLISNDFLKLMEEEDKSRMRSLKDKIFRKSDDAPKQ